MIASPPSHPPVYPWMGAIRVSTSLILFVRISHLTIRSLLTSRVTDQTQGSRVTPQERVRRDTLSSQARPTLPTSLPEGTVISDNFFLTAELGNGPSQHYNLPAYIKPLPHRICAEDIQYLATKGSLTVPSDTLRNELLRAYIEYVHPYMPLLDLREFLDVIESGNGTEGRISLLLFQAVMFAGTTFVDMKFLRESGFTSRKAARKSFFQRARVSPLIHCHKSLLIV
jgi:hypothetical protein